MNYEHEKAYALYAETQERARILEIIRKMDALVSRDYVIEMIEA